MTEIESLVCWEDRELRLKENTEKTWPVAKTELSIIGEGRPTIFREGCRALL